GLAPLAPPRIGVFDSITDFAHGWIRARPKSGRAINMHPGPGRVRALADSSDRIDSARIDVAGLCDNQGTLIKLRNLVRPHSSLIVGRNDFDIVGPEAEHRNGFVDRGVRVGSDDDTDAGRAVEALPGHIPPAPAK